MSTLETIIGTGGDDTISIVPGGTQSYHIDGLAGNDTLRGGDGDDYLLGGNDDDWIEGLVGDDTLEGDSGDDILIGGLGADSMSGGSGNDTLYVTSQDVYYDGGSGNDTGIVGDAFGITITMSDHSFENFWGNDGNDTINAGTIQNAFLHGGNGDDVLTGGTGADTLEGAVGSDTLDGGAGNDFLDGGAGDDTVDGGAGVDTVQFAGWVSGYDISYNGVTGAWTVADTDTSDGVVGTDELTGIEHLYFTGFAETYNLVAPGGVTSASGDIVQAGATGGLIEGLGGNDIVIAGFGDDTINGGTGVDTVRLDGSISGYDFSYDTVTGAWTVADVDTSNGFFGTDVLTGVEHLYFTDLGETYNLVAPGGATSATGDIVQADAAGGVIEAQGGDDVLIGGSGADTIQGSFGDDLIFVSAGADRLDGASDFDTLSAEKSSVGVSLNLDTDIRSVGGVNYAGETLLAGSDTQQVFGFEKVIGSAFDDVIFGDDDGDVLLGGDGNDYINGVTGTDILDGEGGNDTVVGGGSADQLFGGEGNDRLNGNGGNDTLDGGSGDDRLNGHSGSDILNGGSGDDRLNGGGDNDVLDGGAGDDSLTGGSGNDTIVFGDGSGSDEIADFATGDLIDVSGISAVNNFAELENYLTSDAEGFALLSLNANDQLLFKGVMDGSLTADDFLF